MSSTPRAGRDISFARLITTCIAARLLVDTGTQMFHPFLPIFAAGLNTDVVVMGRLVSLSSAMGLFAPFFGSFADRTSYRRVIAAGLLAGAVGMAVIGSSGGIPQAMAGMVLIGLGLAAVVPTLQAYLGARLPYHKLARGMGMMEYSWALVGIVGLSLMGLLIEATSWRTPFFVLSAGMVVMGLVFRTLPSARAGREIPAPIATSSTRMSASIIARIRAFFRIESNAVSTYAAILAAAAIYYAGVQFMIVYGVWFADQYDLGARELGIVALLFGCFDLAGSVSVSIFTDNFGKRRSVILGATGALLGFLLVPWLNIGVIPAVLSAAFACGFFEFAIVANLPLLSEQSPTQRAKVMTLNLALILVMSTIASFVTPVLYIRIGIAGIAIISATCTAISLLLLLTRVRGPRTILWSPFPNF